MTYPTKSVLCFLYVIQAKFTKLLNKRSLVYLLLTICLASFSHGAFASDDPFNNTTNSAAHFFDPAYNDQSLVYLGEIFGDIPPVLAGTGSSLMGELFAVFNSAVLVLGIFFLGYTAFVGILNTAGEGEMLGRKWSSIWVPIRMVAGLGLIIPTSSGYCVCQVFVMWLIVQGVGAADHLTNTILDYMEAGKPTYVIGQTAATSEGGSTSVNTYDKSIKQLYSDLTCMQANPDKDSTDAIVPPEPTCGTNSDGTLITGSGACANTDHDITYHFKAPNGEECGKVVFLAPVKYDDNGIQTESSKQYAAASSSIMNAVDMVTPSLNSAAYYLVNYNPNLHDDDTDPNHENDANSYSPDTDDKSEILQATYDFVGSNFLNQLQQTYTSYISEGNTAVDALSSSNTNEDYFEDIRDYGWVALGGVYWYMAKNAEYQDAGGFTGNYASYACLTSTTTDNPDDNAVITNYNACVPISTTTESARTYVSWSQEFFDGLVTMQKNNTTDGSAYADESYDYSHQELVLGDMANYFIGYVLNETMNAVMEDLAQPNQNPMVSAQRVGRKTMDGVEYALPAVVGFVLGMSALGGLMASMQPGFLILQAAVSYAVPTIFLWLMFFYTIGGFLAVLVPILPAVIYFLAVTNWMVTVVESIVAAPIVAIGALHAEGHEVWGKAEPAVLLLANMFLRPALIVIGMAAGVILSFVFMQFINFAFFSAMGATLTNSFTFGIHTVQWDSSPRPAELVLYLMTYIGLLLAVLNQVFTIVSLLPDQVMRWIAGGEGAKFAGSGGADQLGKVEQQQAKGQEHTGGQIKAAESGSSSNAGGGAMEKYGAAKADQHKQNAPNKQSGNMTSNNKGGNSTPDP